MSQNRTTEIIDIVFNKDINSLNVNNPGFMNQNNSPFNGIFGGRLVTQRKPELAQNFLYPSDSRFGTNTLVGDGSIDFIGPLLTVTTGTTTGSSAEFKGKRNLRYVAGRDAEIMFTGIYTAGTGDSQIRVGLFDDDNGFAIGTLGADFGAFRKVGGVWVDEITQANFNLDKLDGSGPSEFFLDKTKMNIFRITYGYLGIAPIFYQVYSGKEKSWVTFHVIDLTNSQTTTHVENPYLPPNVFVDNGTTTDDLKFESGSVYAGVYGGSGVQRDVSARRFSVDIATFTSVGGVESPFAVFHNKPTYQGKDNKIEDILGIFQAAVDGTKSSKIKVYNVPAADVVGGTFADVDTQNSNLEFSDSSTGLPTVSLANAELFTIFTTERIGNIREDVSTFNYVLFPDDYAVFTVLSANATEIDSSIDELELF